MFSTIRHTEHPTLCITQPFLQSNAHPSHQTPTDRRRGVGLGCNPLACRGLQRKMQHAMETSRTEQSRKAQHAESPVLCKPQRSGTSRAVQWAAKRRNFQKKWRDHVNRTFSWCPHSICDISVVEFKRQISLLAAIAAVCLQKAITSSSLAG